MRGSRGAALPHPTQQHVDLTLTRGRRLARSSPVHIRTRRLVLRRVTRGDRDNLACLFESNAESFRICWPLRDQFDSASAERYVDVESGRRNGVCLAIVERATSRIIGSAALLMPNPVDRVPWIGVLVIEADRQRMGFGSEAAEVIEQLAASLGWSEIRVNVLAANSGARRFWERLGYREVPGTWRAYDSTMPGTVRLHKHTGFRSPPGDDDGGRLRVARRTASATARPATSSAPTSSAMAPRPYRAFG